MYPSSRIIRGGAFVLGIVLTLGIFFSFNHDRSGLTANISDAIVTDSVVRPDLISYVDGNTMFISTARSFPIHKGQSFRIDILYNPVVFGSPEKQFSLSSPFLLSDTLDSGIISLFLAIPDGTSIPSGTALASVSFPPVTDASDLPILESVYRYDNEQSEALHVMYQ